MAPKKKEKARRARGEGGLAQRANGLWVARVELAPDPVTGKRKQVTVSSMSHSNAVAKLNALKEKLAKNGSVPTNNMTTSQWMSYFMEHIDSSRPTTRASYRSCIRYIDAAIGKIKLDKLEPSDVRKLESHITRTLRLSSTTALQAYRVLSRALKYAEREGKMVRNVAQLVDPPKKAAPNLAELSPEEGYKILDTVAYDRLGSRYAMGLLTGARQGEILGLEIDRVDFEEDTIDLSWQLQRVKWRHGCEDTGKVDDAGKTIWGCGRKRGTDCSQRYIDAPPDWEHRHITGGLYWSRPKSEAGRRIIPLVEPLREILWRRIQASSSEPNPHGLVWTSDQKKSKGGRHTARRILPLDGSPIDPSKDWAAWHEVCHRAEVTDVRVHDARHAAATILYDLEVPETIIQDILGQSVVAVTRGYRNKTKRSRKPQREALERLGERMQARSALAIVSAPAALEAAEGIEEAVIVETDAA